MGNRTRDVQRVEHIDSHDRYLKQKRRFTGELCGRFKGRVHDSTGEKSAALPKRNADAFSTDSRANLLDEANNSQRQSATRRISAASSGGANAFSTVMAQTVVGSHALTVAEMPSHGHGVTGGTGAGDGSVVGAGTGATIALSGFTGITVSNNGGGGSHNHTITLAIAYADCILGHEGLKCCLIKKSNAPTPGFKNRVGRCSRTFLPEVHIMGSSWAATRTPASLLISTAATTRFNTC
jgi:hypothetical protein